MSVSIIGTANTTIGAPKVKNVEVLNPKPNKEITDNMKPINKAPQSPMNIFAGWKLNTKNPPMDPASKSVNEVISVRP